MPFQIKRAYEPPSSSDGSRVLVDRLWPRGIKKSTAALFCWMKDIAPSPALRQWFDHRPDRFEEFRRRYERELSHNALVPKLRDLGRNHLVTLVYGARDPLINHARVLRDALTEKHNAANLNSPVPEPQEVAREIRRVSRANAAQILAHK